MGITNHGYKRMAERMGLSKKAAMRMLEKVWFLGIPAEDCKGSLRKWAMSLYEKNERNLNKILLYGDKAFLFGDGLLVTVLHIPQEYMKIMKCMKNKVYAA